MNILVLSWRDTDHPLAGGAEVSLFEHAKFWKKKGAHVSWLSSSFPGAKSTEEREGIKIIRRGSHFSVHIYAFFYYLRFSKNFTDIIIDNFHFIPFFTPLYISRKKIIALINEPAKNAWFKNIFFPLNIIGYLLEPLFFLFYKNISFITSASSIAKELEEYGVNSKNIHIIPHGVSKGKAKKQIQQDQIVLVCLSQIAPDKGIQDALYTLAKIKKEYNQSVLWIIGKSSDIKYKKGLQDLARALHIEESVTFYGFVSEQKKFELLAKAFILIHPSIREGWGLNVIEANTVGTPAVGYNVTGLQDSILHKKTGLLTTENTPDNLAKSILYLIQHKSIYKKLSNNAIVWANNFTWENAGKKSWKLIKKVYELKK